MSTHQFEKRGTPMNKKWFTSAEYAPVRRALKIRSLFSVHTHRSLFRQNHFSVRGFSLIELIVVVAIIAVISTVILANHTRFNGSVLLSSLAYDIALSVREAQVFGVSVREFSSDFQVGYGVRFTDSNSYVFFVDTNANKQYDDGIDTILTTYNLSRGHMLEQFCGITSVGTSRCSDSQTPITHLDIVFFRPESDALMSSNEPGFYSRGTVTVSSAAGETRTIQVASTGQISVENL